MARPGRPERNRAARSFRQLRRFHHVINSDKVFGTHRGIFVGRLSWRGLFQPPPRRPRFPNYLVVNAMDLGGEALVSWLRSTVADDDVGIDATGHFTGHSR